jgi:hypothetical protein
MRPDPRLRTIFCRMVSRANIAHRNSFLDPQKGSRQFSSHDAHMAGVLMVNLELCARCASGDAGAGARAPVPGLCQWRGGEPDYHVRMKIKKTCTPH